MDKDTNKIEETNGAKPCVMRRFLIEYKCLGKDYYVELSALNINSVMKIFAESYSQIEQIYNIEDVSENAA